MQAHFGILSDYKGSGRHMIEDAGQETHTFTKVLLLEKKNVVLGYIFIHVLCGWEEGTHEALCDRKFMKANF